MLYYLKTKETKDNDMEPTAPRYIPAAEPTPYRMPAGYRVLRCANRVAWVVEQDGTVLEGTYPEYVKAGANRRRTLPCRPEIAYPHQG
jgi:hypothetical protein